MPLSEPLHQAGEHPRDYARLWKERSGGKVVGYFCSYTPQELISAARALPFRIWSSGADISRADSHLQAYSCSLVRGALEDALAGRLDFLDGAAFPHTCDSIMRLSDIWRMNTHFGFHADLVMPVKLNTDSAAEYMTAVLHRFRSDLEKGLGVNITDQRLHEAIQDWNRVRRLLGSLYARRAGDPSSLGAAELHQVFRAAMVMEPRASARALEALIHSLPAAKPDRRPAGVPIILSGGLCGMPDIHQVVEAAGGRVVWDDFCTGARYFEGLVDESEEPVAALARRLLTRVVCPAKHTGIHSRGHYLLDKVRQQGARGVVFLYLKFCDPHAFDHPYLKAMLDEEGIPSMLIEVEDATGAEGQLRTRLEAFMEMV
ncbi:2-hydroxyacyl-CoA dehydratase subunit D [Desulfatitalea alkaliphila]|uniref:2-hydroxyacyl-CoA dehydratase family protein n=1 Tax=Desulfatitalea alkaliphila TaxID=2929485 RepID=A0AA41R563_9BACT|nr:2-hydroxyacyl-CoA dehydratase family protein [Desulfatitalea alkaliphila]MCJ8499403.1 2-hydroxyacyl-CoA dehydratase family protein [Desulfatitalea alkaliphila]